MEIPLVTVIVVSYNQGKYIKENLDSIKAQTYSNIELIIADDASSDNSVEIFESWLFDNNMFAKKNFHQKNTGLATVLNECIELTNGKYIKLIAADDYLDSESIEKCVLKLEEKGTDFGMVFSDTYAIDDNSEIINDIANYDNLGNVDPFIFREKLLENNRIAALTVLMRRDVLIETGKYDSKFIVEDYYRWLKINDKYLIAYIPNKLAYYRLHDHNISKLKEKKIIEESVILQILFDKKGKNRKRINDYVFNNYKNNISFSNYFLNAYKKYFFKYKRLSLAVTNNIPFFIFKLINRIF